MNKEHIERERYYKYSMLYDLAYHDDVNGNCDGKIDITVVDCISGADVVPVRHGAWLKHNNYYKECSLCGFLEYNSSNYCPNCGAKMDGGNK